MAISATLNQDLRPVAFIFRALLGSEIYYLGHEKEATRQLLLLRQLRNGRTNYNVRGILC